MFDHEGNIRVGRFALLCFGVLLLGIAVMTARGGRGVTASRETPAEANRSTSTYVATQTCQDWTRKHSRIGVGEMLGDRRVDDAKHPGYFRIVLNWRTQGNGLLMASDCKFVDKDKLFTMLSAESGLAQ